MLRVAIDGPGGTGKSTIAKAVAERLGLEYIDTGAMYRSIALKSVRLSVPVDDEPKVIEMLADTVIDFNDNKVTCLRKRRRHGRTGYRDSRDSGCRS